MDYSIHIQLAGLLMDLEADLRNQRLWHRQTPSEEALSSTEPFACDTLLFTEWVQFVFIPRLYQLVEQEGELPATCDVAPMAEEYFKVNRQQATGNRQQATGNRQQAQNVIDSLRRIDLLIANSK